MRFDNLLWCYTLPWIATYRAMAEQTIAACEVFEATFRPMSMPMPVPIPVPRRASGAVAASGTVVPFPMHRVRRPQRQLA
ncbi:MAG TPA: hypothetical protein VGD08_26035 [Stellaceae bacterium]|jgi:hypothetical protein